MYPESHATEGGQLPSDLEKEILQVLKRDGKLHAIKSYKELTGLSLKEAKDTVEAIAKKYNVKTEHPKGCAGILALGLVILVIVWLAVMP